MNEKLVVLDIKTLKQVAITTVFLVFGLMILGRLAGAIATPLIFILLSVVLMMGLNPLVVGLETHFKLPRRFGAVLVVLGLLALMAGFIAVAIPLFVAQGMKFAETLPDIWQNLQSNLKHLANKYPLLAPLLQGIPSLYHFRNQVTQIVDDRYFSWPQATLSYFSEGRGIKVSKHPQPGSRRIRERG